MDRQAGVVLTEVRIRKTRCLSEMSEPQYQLRVGR